MEELEIKLREMLLRIEDLEKLVGDAIGSIGGLQAGDVVEVVSCESEYNGKTFTVLEVFNQDNVLLDNNFWFSKERLKKIP